MRFSLNKHNIFILLCQTLLTDKSKLWTSRAFLFVTLKVKTFIGKVSGSYSVHAFLGNMKNASECKETNVSSKLNSD